MRNITKKEFLSYVLLVLAFCEPIGVSLKMLTLLDVWVYLPSFPDTLDFVFLILSVSYLTYRAVKK